MEEKLDLIREYKHLYNPPNRDFTIVEIPAFSFLMLDGMGDPNTAQAYKDALQALYSLAYTIKFAWKKQTEQDYRVMPLEGLWWVENLAELDFNNKNNWHWTMIIHQPAFITTEIFQAAQKAVQKKSGSDLVLSVRLEEYKEGTAVQVLYFGPFRR